jgi:Zn-dependent protease
VTVAPAVGATVCGACGTEVAPALLACPACRHLVHARELRELTARGEAAAAAGDALAALTAWRASLDLLPPESRQFAAIAARVEALSRSREAAGALGGDAPPSGVWKWIAVLGPAGLLLWKFKFVLVLLATKGKFVLLGLTKSSTLFSMLLSLGVYWTAWGLWFALGFVVSLYIHEMGHVAALRHYGIAASAPMFIPGVGAFIRLRQPPMSPREDARVALAGPLWGLGAAIAAYAIALAGGGAYWAAIARTGAWLNLFNLLPVWQLDGGRAFGALARSFQWLIVLAFGAAWIITEDGLLALLLLAGVVRAATGAAPTDRDAGALAQFLAITLALAIVFRLATLIH